MKKKLLMIMTTVLLLTMSTETHAGRVVPIVVPHRPRVIRMVTEEEKQEKIRERVGVYKLGENPLNLLITKEKYKEVENLCLGKEIWTKKSIYKKTIQDIRERDRVLLFDKHTNKGYEIPYDEMKSFLVKEYKDVNLTNPVDVIEIEIADETRAMEMASFEIIADDKHYKLEVQDRQLEEVKNTLENIKERNGGKTGLSVIQVKIGSEETLVSKAELNEITSKIDTEQAKIAQKEASQLSSYYLFQFVGILIVIIVIIFALLIR